jgi:hypothetical protein
MPSYRHLRAWSLFMKSSKSWTEKQVALANSDRAPFNAIYKDGDLWITFEDIDDQDTRERVLSLMADTPQSRETATN